MVHSSIGSVLSSLNQILCFSPILKLPDFTKPFVLEPDALDVAVKAVLLQ